MPRRSSISARCASYSPNSSARWRLLSKGTTRRFLAEEALVGLPAPEAAAPRYAFKMQSLPCGQPTTRGYRCHYTSLCSGDVTPVQHVRTKSDLLSHDSGQAVGAGIRDFDGQNAAEQAGLGLGVDSLKVGRAPDELAGLAPKLLEQNREHPAHAAGIELPLLRLQQLLQPSEPGGLDLLRHLFLDVGRRGAGSRAVLEGERLRKSDLPHQLE